MKGNKYGQIDTYNIVRQIKIVLKRKFRQQFIYWSNCYLSYTIYHLEALIDLDRQLTEGERDNEVFQEKITRLETENREAVNRVDKIQVIILAQSIKQRLNSQA